jgi:hypothetical protein
MAIPVADVPVEELAHRVGRQKRIEYVRRDAQKKGGRSGRP